MATRTQKTKVGLFIVICVVLAAGSLLMLSGYKHEEKIPYWIEFEESVLGLTTDSTVEYLGVPVGKVSNIYVTKDNKAHTDILITKSKVTLREGVTAQLVLYSLATGTMIVQLQGGDGKPLPPGHEIPAQKSLITAVSSRIENILDDLRDITETVKNGLEGMQEGDLASLFDDADSFIASGQEFLSQATETLSDVKGQAQSGLDDFKDLAQDVKKLVRDTDTAVKKASKKIESFEVSQTQENLNKVLADISALSERLQQSANALDTMSRRALHEAGNVEFNLRETLRTLSESLDAVRDLTTYLKKDPSALIWGKGKPKGEP